MLCLYLHQLTACTLYLQGKEAYEIYQSTHNCRQALTEAEWILNSEKSPMFKYWNFTLNMELNLLEFVKSIRSGDFNNYIATLLILAPWMFVLNNYVSWLHIHIRCKMNLRSQNQNVYAEFLKGKFVVQKTNRKFSRIGLDHNHGQENSKIKGVCGAIRLTENDSSLRKLLISGPEYACLLEEFELRYGIERPDDKIIKSIMIKIKLRKLGLTMMLFLSKMHLDYPFCSNSNDLISIGTNICTKKINENPSDVTIRQS